MPVAKVVTLTLTLTLTSFEYDERARDGRGLLSGHLRSRMQRCLAWALLLLATSIISAAVWPTYERTHWWSKARTVAVS